MNSKKAYIEIYKGNASIKVRFYVEYYDLLYVQFNVTCNAILSIIHHGIEYAICSSLTHYFQSTIFRLHKNVIF